MQARKCLVTISFLFLLPWLFSYGCNSQIAPSNHATDPTGERLKAIAAGGTLADLRWPNFTDYRTSAQKLYEAVTYASVWVRDGQASPQALAIIAEFVSSQKRGLIPEDYDASRWPQRLNALKVSSGNPDTLAHFDAALTVCAMRYIFDLHTGRINPQHLAFSVTIEKQNYDLSEFLAKKVLTSNNIPELLNAIEATSSSARRAVPKSAIVSLQICFAAMAQGSCSMLETTCRLFLTR